MITSINESKLLTKYVSCKCECKSDVRKLSSNQTISVAVIVKISKNKNLCKKGILYLDSAARNCENGGKYLAIVIDDSVIM